MPKRKATFNSPDSNDDHDTKRASRAISFQPINSFTLFDELSGELEQANLVGNESISRGLSINSSPTRVKPTGLHEGSFRPQHPAQDTGAFHNLTAKSSLATPSTEYAPSPPSSYPLLRVTHPEHASAYSTVSSSTTATANNVRPDNEIPQMTYKRYQALLRSLNHIREDPCPAQNTARPTTLVGNNLGPRSDRQTDFKADQAEWSIDNLPDILYAFEPPDDYYASPMLKEPPLKTYTIHGSAVRDIPILPNRISPDPEGWLYECWCRMDPRIQYRRDIEPRIRPDLRPKHVTRFSCSRLRFRQECHLLGWLIKRANFVSERDEILEAATEAGIDVEATNSTRGLSWGLVDPAQGEAGGRIPVPKSLRPKNTREDVQSAQNLFCAPGSDDALPAASSPRALRQTPALGAETDDSLEESPPPDQAVLFNLDNGSSTTRSNKHAHSEADPVQMLKAQSSSRQAILSESLSSSGQSISPVARPCSAKQSEMLPAQSSPAQNQSLQLKNNQRRDAMYLAWNTIPTDRLKHESSSQYPATAGLDEKPPELETRALNTAVDVRHQRLHSYFGDSALVELGESSADESPRRSKSSNESKPSNVCEGDAQAPLTISHDTSSTCVPVAYEMSHFKASDVYQGYARSDEQFFQNESSTYVPLLLKDIPPRTSQPFSSISASVSNGGIQARPPQAQEKVETMEQHDLLRQVNMDPVDQTEDAVRPLQHTDITPIQHAEHNFFQKAIMLNQVANDALRNNPEVPGLAVTLVTNELVEAFYQRNNELSS